MKSLIINLLIANLMCSLSFAKDRILVSNFQTNSESVSDTELLALTERVIVIISEIKTYDLITKENILTLLPPAQNLEECIGKCEIETGRLVGANKVISGWVIKSKGLYQLSLKLHDTKTGTLESVKLVSSKNLEGVLSQVQNLIFNGSSFLRADKETERSLENKLSLMRSLRLQRERDIRVKRQQELRVKKMIKRMEKKKEEEEERIRLWKRIRLMIKRQKGGVKSKQSWAITSPYIDYVSKRGGAYRKFLFHPGLVPSLTLSEGWEGRVGVREFVLADLNSLGGFFFKHPKKAIKGSYNRDKNYSQAINLDQVEATKKGVGYDKEGRILEPVSLKIERMGLITIFYVNKKLFMEDMAKYECDHAVDPRSYRKGCSTSFNLMAARILIFSFNSPLSFLLTMGQIHGGINKNLFGGLLATNVLVWGLCAFWWCRDTNKYHYPKYVDYLKGVGSVSSGTGRVIRLWKGRGYDHRFHQLTR